MVKISLSSAGDAGSIPGQGARIPHALQPKQTNKQTTINNRSNLLTNSVNASKMVHIKKKKIFKKVRKNKKKAAGC